MFLLAALSWEPLFRAEGALVRNRNFQLFLGRQIVRSRPDLRVLAAGEALLLLPFLGSGVLGGLLLEF